MQRDVINKLVLFVLIVFISTVFLTMIRAFLMAIFLAGIFSALSYPIFKRIEHHLGGLSNLAALGTLLLLVMVIMIPLGTLTGIVTNQAIKVGQTVTPWVQKQISQPNTLSELFSSLPFYEEIAPYRTQILQKAGEVVGGISRFLIDRLSSGAIGAIQFLVTIAILLYTMFFFLLDGPKLLNKILYYLPLEDDDERLLLAKFTSVTRATIKGTLVIGILQGGLSGLAFWIVGIPSAAFWGTIMAVLSIIPGVGTALIWIPAAVFLAVTGNYLKTIGLVLFCGLVTGSVDNLLRPILVGKDTQMHELMIFFGTMGGIMMFGIVGMIIGPIVAALFVTLWEIYGIAFKEILPAVKGCHQEDESEIFKSNSNNDISEVESQ
jgi:predicted PurR-regulated permease PerM